MFADDRVTILKIIGAYLVAGIVIVNFYGGI